MVKTNFTITCGVGNLLSLLRESYAPSKSHSFLVTIVIGSLTRPRIWVWEGFSKGAAHQIAFYVEKNRGGRSTCLHNVALLALFGTIFSSGLGFIMWFHGTWILSSKCFHLMPVKGRGAKGCRSYDTVLWLIWKSRNDYIFNWRASKVDFFLTALKWNKWLIWLKSYHGNGFWGVHYSMYLLWMVVSIRVYE